MALFGPKDRRLPLLTQFYQIKEGDIKEMGHLLNRLRGMEAVGEMEGDEEQTQPIMRLHELARRIMDQAIDGRVQRGHTWAFNRYWKENSLEFGFRAREEHPPLYARHPRRLPRGLQATDFCPLSDLTEARFNHDDPWRDLETKVVLDVAAMLRGGGKDLARCTECQSVFVASRRGQLFCSHRCGDRHSARSRRRARIATSDEKGLQLAY